MPGEENESKTFLDLLITGGLGAVLAALFQAVRSFRKHNDDAFNLRQFCAGLVSAAAVGALAAWTLDALHVSRELSAVIIAMCGYTGGRLLDLIEAEIPETLQSAFDGIQEKLKNGEWKK